MPYEIWLTYNNQEEGFQLPVMPGSIEIGDGSKSKTFDVAGLGEINVINNPKLKEYSFSSIFPSVGKRLAIGRIPGSTVDPYISANILLGSIVVNGVKTNGYVHLITKWMAASRPIRFVFIGDTFDINTPVSIEGFDWKEVAGGGGDIEYTLKLKEYVFYAAKKVTAAETEQGMQLYKVPALRQNDMQPPQTYTLVPGDNLWAVAQRLFGDGSRWKEIQQLNNIRDAELENLQVGMVLRLPVQGGFSHD